jgi:hyperosmotically inducible periplasmic protein
MNKLIRSAGLAACLVVVTPMFVACATDPEREAGQTVDDAAITAKVKSQLLADPNVSGLNVNVTTFKGQVQLSGYVESAEQRAQAEQLAKAVEGVQSVSNDLIVKPAEEQGS